MATFDGPLLHDRFRLGPRLGVGGQGRTYLARDEQDGREVVVKVLSLGEAGWKKFDLFEREVRVLRHLSHPGIPRVLDSFEGDKGTFYLVMERAPGATLRAIASRAHFTEAELRDLLARTLEILAYLHGLSPPVIHRDLKPANLLRAADGRVSLVDFGGVRETVREDGGTTVVGTFGYMAPEQLHGEASPRTDLYGLGATIVALAGGVEPEKVPRKGLRMDLARHLSSLDAGLVGLLQRMTDPEPDRRPPSARAVLEELSRGTRAQPLSPGRELPLLEETGRLPSGVIFAAPDEDDLAGLPGPARVVIRMLLIFVGVVGYVGLTILQAAILPIVFSLMTSLSKEAKRPKLRSTETAIRGALQSGRKGFRDLGRRSLRAPPKGKALPPGRRP